MIDATRLPPARRAMKYANREMKIDQIINYFNDNKISLIPPFQRGSVWPLSLRRKLIENMVMERPIPAIFLYKKDEGAQFTYNILDGKQRLESLLLFVGNQRNDVRVNDIDHYFMGKSEVFGSVNFTIELDGEEVDFKRLDNSLVRRFREYAISTIEIDLDEEKASFDEVVSLFVDINQKGIKVSRFDVVKGLVRDRLFKQVSKLIAHRKDRKKSTYYTLLNNSFAFVLGKLSVVSKLSDQNSKVDRVWERMTEIALFAKTLQHRAPAQILKSFINLDKEINERLDDAEESRLRAAFGFLAGAYRHNKELGKSKVATDQPQFYTLITTLISSDLLERYPHDELEKRIWGAATLLDESHGVRVPAGLRRTVGDYRSASEKQTTDSSKRDIRQRALIRIIDSVEV
jgi:hypothetical protein